MVSPLLKRKRQFVSTRKIKENNHTIGLYRQLFCIAAVVVLCNKLIIKALQKCLFHASKVPVLVSETGTFIAQNSKY